MQCLHSYPHTNCTLDWLNHVEHPPVTSTPRKVVALHRVRIADAELHRRVGALAQPEDSRPAATSGQPGGMWHEDHSSVSRPQARSWAL